MNRAAESRRSLRSRSALARRLVVAAAAACVIGTAGIALSQGLDDFEDAPINYSKSQPTDVIARLQERLDKNQTTLASDAVRGYLPALLKQLNVPVSSQTLVFSKTSFQREVISPRTPRAVYFNENAYVGWEQNAPVLEIS